MTRLRQLACDVWILAKGYWRSEERWSARVLLTSIIGLNLGLVGVNVLQNQANGALFTALQQRNAPGFYRAFVIVIVLILLYLVVAVLRVYRDQTLQLRWRRWLTDQYVTRWLANRTFYRMRFSGRVDNPDQRISEDVRLFTPTAASHDRILALQSEVHGTLSPFDRKTAGFSPGRVDALVWALSDLMTQPMKGFGIFELYRQMAAEQTARESVLIEAPAPAQQRHEAIRMELQRYAALMADRPPTPAEAAAHVAAIDDIMTGRHANA